MRPSVVCTFLVIASCLVAGEFQPEFTAAGIARGIRPAKKIVPGSFLSIYGRNLGPAPGRCGTAMPQDHRPIEFCGTQVLIGDAPAELLYVSDTQINFRVPDDSPRSGTVDVRVVHDGWASSPVTLAAGFEQTIVSLDGPAYTDMPIWLKIDLPYEFEGTVRYPFVVGPAYFGCNEVEVRRDGRAMPLLPASNWMRYGMVIGGNICGSIAIGPRNAVDRLPIHLLYRFDLPGTYEVRYSLRNLPFGAEAGNSTVRATSQWTRIEVLPAKAGMRAEWLRAMRNRAPADPTELLTDVLPGLLGIPDAGSFELLTEYLYHSDVTVRQYALNGLEYWPEEYTWKRMQALLRSRGSNDVIERYFTARQGRR